MKTDRQKLINLFTEFGIGFLIKENVIECMQGMEKVDGFGAFFTTFEFDETGKFIQMGVWE